ncbi:kinase-like domain-containing protein [Phanerochaete sordida]|uniref:Kinase-like domain-containing protein n=1 Tax=Phanerochaete sordida TaxID=48140 RepID=A0A9P3GH57_9APHY|nr:kinase-like domain-containing protein [Phanerochaete sordida]
MERHEWTADELGHLQARGLEHYPLDLDRINRVQLWYGEGTPDVVVKSLDRGATELAILQTLLAHPARGNRTIPTELLPCEKTYLAVMPALNRTVGFGIWPNFERIVRFSHDLLQGVSFMHSLEIAHCDIHPNNVVQADPEEQYAATIESGRMYIIDFGISRFMSPKMPLPADRVPHMQGHYDPPEGRDAAEPYSYDVYCVGAAIRTVCWDTTNNHSRANRVAPSLWAFARALTAADPARRPSVRHARAMFAILRRWLMLTRWVHWLLPIPQADRIDLCGWYFLCRLVLSAVRRRG